MANLFLENDSQTLQVDLVAGVLQVKHATWSPAYVEGDVIEPVRETIPLYGSDTLANLQAEAVDVDELLDLANKFMEDFAVKEPVWLRFRPDASSTYQRVQVQRGSAPLLVGQVEDWFLDGLGLPLNLDVLRTPFWEPTSRTTVTMNNLSANGGFTAITSITGSADARIEELRVNGDTGVIAKFWAGIRPKYEGSSSFDPVLEIEDGINGADCSDIVDASASGGNYTRCTFATQTGLVSRSILSLLDAGVTTNQDHYYGRYTVIARLRVTSTREAGVLLKHGFFNSPNRTPNEEVKVTDTNWRLYSLGDIQIPPHKVHPLVGTAEVKYFTLELFAESLAGSGNLEMDNYVLVPSRHQVYADDAVISSLGSNVKFFTLPDERQYAVSYNNANEPDVSIPQAMTNWRLPVGDSVFVFVGERTASHVITDQVDVVLYHFKRWRGYLE